MSTTRVKALKPPKSVFDLSYEKKFDFNFGQLIPVCCEEMVPGDIFKVGNEIVIRFNPLFAPILQEINAYVHYFFVPTRLIFEDWEKFITGGEDGQDSTVLPRYYKNGAVLPTGISEAMAFGPYSLYDYFGFPLVKSSLTTLYQLPGDFTNNPATQPSFFYRPLAFPWRCYNLIYNEYYMDETLQTPVDLDQPLVLNRNWSKDYFTSALESQQRGVAPAISMKGKLPVYFTGSAGEVLDNQLYAGTLGSGWTGDPSISGNDSGSTIPASGKVSPAYVDLGSGVGIDATELRLTFQIQKWMERNMRSGVRYTEFLHAHYGVSPRDDRLQRPEYIGGSKSPIIVSEVIQNSNNAASGTSSGTGTGSLYGKGITADRNFICSYHAKEFGYLVGILSVLPKSSYQQGVDRKWLRKSRFDFYSPEFAHLSEQAVTNEELFAFAGDEKSGIYGNGDIFGYQAVWNEMRGNQSKVCGALRDTLDHWHLGRQFSSLPQLNSDFITCDSTRDDLMRIFQVNSVPGMICNFANIITAIRPLPKFGEPGLIDHN